MRPPRNHEPPKLGIRILRWFCKKDLFEEIEGDLYEYFQIYNRQHPGWKAKIFYWIHLFSFFRRYAVKNESNNSKYSIMLINHIKFALRYLKKHPSSTALNILSLSTGIACFLFIFLFIEGEFSFDKYHKDSDRIHRVAIDFMSNGQRIPDATTPPALAPAIKANFPEVEEATRIFPTWGGKFLMGVTSERQFYEQEVYRVDANFLKVFTYEALKGNPDEMLSDPSNIVLTESMASKYFGEEDPMGKEITLFNRNNQKKIVTGVINDVPFNSHFRFDFLIPLHFEDRNIDEMWGWYNYYTYVKLKEDTEVANFEEKLQPLYLSSNAGDSINPNIAYSQPLTDIHLNSALKWELGSNNNMSNIRIFISIGMFILLISMINYLNLTVGHISQRNKEAGVRKTFGANRSTLVSQFVVEAITIILISLVIGTLLTELVVSKMDSLFGREISLLDTSNLTVVLVLSLVTLGLGILAGVYPALRFASMGDIKKIISHKRGKTLDLKRILLVAQFAISTLMIVGTMVVYKQLNYFKNSDKGFNSDQVLIVENARSTANQQVLKDKLSNLPFVTSAGFSDGIVGDLNWTFTIGYPDQFLMNYAVVSPDYIETMEFEFLAGRNFDSSIETDATGMNFIVNESGMRELNVTLDQVGESIVVGNEGDSLIYGKIIGVIKDFHYSNFKSEIKPYSFFFREEDKNYMAIRMNSSNTLDNLEKLESEWNELAVGVPFESYFLDQSFSNLHKTEERLSRVMLALTGLSIFIAFVGMLAIVNIVVKSRLKEVAVRKALGATTEQVVSMFSKKFILLVVIANAIGLPLAYFAMRTWLSDFAYRTSIDFRLFVLAFVATSLMAFIIVGTRSFKAATDDLSQRLNDE
ncbi:ABC transporter permease [Ekhidna sp. To15]|uniref:ABC transporter permease n=1 Tax=Ekhidna sp. To15 TaxID=3395267 RepID=UPI003F51F3BB